MLRGTRRIYDAAKEAADAGSDVILEYDHEPDPTMSE
jgi:hypothetical protein